MEQTSSSPFKKKSLRVNLGEATFAGLQNESEQSAILPVVEDEMVSDIKSFCTKYEDQGKDVLVVVAGQDQCRWYGTRVASQCVTDLYSLIFKFFYLCQEVRSNKTKGNKITVRHSEYAKNRSAYQTRLADPVDNQLETHFDKNVSKDCINDNSMEADNGESDVYELAGPDGESEGDDDVENPGSEDPDYQEEKVELLVNNENGTKLNGVSDIDEKVIGDFLEGRSTDLPHSCLKCECHFAHEAHLQTHTQKVLNCDQIKLEQAMSNKDVLQEEVTYTDPDTGKEIRTTLKDVIDRHKSTAALRCLICGKTFKLRRRLRKHTLQHIKTPIYQCSICGEHFKRHDSLVYHTRTHFQRPYECVYCQKRFQTEGDCSEHSMTCTKRRLFENETSAQESVQCEKCNFKTPNQVLMAAHKTSHLGPALCVCTLCGVQVGRMSSLNRHLLFVHSDNRPFPCPICKVKSFKNVGCLNRHVKSHGEKTHVCEICDKRFVDKGYLTAHLKIHSGTQTPSRPDTRSFVCDFCGREFRKKDKLDNHRRIHTGDAPYKCDLEGCSKAFRSRGCLTQHRRTHETSAQYICDVCGRRFKQPNSLCHHRRSHSEEFQWLCTYCSERFNSLWRFKRHLANTHPDKKEEIEQKQNIILHQCNICNKMYHDKEDYNRHLNNHNGIRPFQCRYCEKSYSDRSNMRAHELTHSGGKKYGCSICHKKFLYEKNLLEHVQRKHPGEAAAMFLCNKPYTADHDPTIDATLATQQQPGFTTQNQQQENDVELTPLQILE